MKNKRNAREIREAFNLLMAGHHLTQDESEEPEKHELAIWYLQLERDAQMQSASEAAAMGHDEAAGDHDRQASALEQMISRIRALQLSSVAWNTGEGSGRNLE